MEQENKVVFRNALNGYSKNDVNDYIIGLAKEVSRRKEEWDSESTRLRTLLDTQDSEKEELVKQKEELVKTLEAAESEKKKYEEQIQKLQDDMKALATANEEIAMEKEILESELAKKKAELDGLNKKLTVKWETAAIQKKSEDALNTEILSLKKQLAEKDSECNALKKQVSDKDAENRSLKETLAKTEDESIERYAKIAKQSGIVERYEAQLQAMKEELAHKNAELANARKELFEKASKTGTDEDAERITSEIQKGMEQLLAELDGKLNDKLSTLAVKPTEEKNEPEKVIPSEEKNYSELDKKIDSFFDNM